MRLLAFRILKCFFYCMSSSQQPGKVKPTGDPTRPFQATSFIDRFCSFL